MRSKARLTITLAKDLLQQIDGMIDNRTIRNRSHAIEMLLRQSLVPRVKTAVILAGEKGQGGLIPALMPIDTQPLIIITLRHLVGYGIDCIHILAGENEAAFRKVIGGEAILGATIHYSKEERLLGTAGAIKSIERQLNRETFLVVHADVLTNINLADFIQFHKNENCLATIAVKPRNMEREYGKVMLQGNRITDFSSGNHHDGISIVNTGVYILEPEVLNLIKLGTYTQFEKDIFPKLAATAELSAFIFQGLWFDISTADNYKLAQVRWTNS